MDVHSAALAQRAHRSFRPEPVPEEQLRRLLSTATRAPSAENTQPWRFVVVRDARLRSAIGELTSRAWAGGGRAHAERTVPPAMLRDVDAGAPGGVAAAPVLVVVCADTTAGMRDLGSAGQMLAGGAEPPARRDQRGVGLGADDAHDDVRQRAGHVA
jgi:nitroreductase